MNLQKKLETELADIEKKHDVKKMKFAEGSEKFHTDLKKVSAA